MPEGYRKALRLMKQAEKFHRPVVCFVDTAGAGCDMGAEERGQGSGHCRKPDGNDVAQDPHRLRHGGPGRLRRRIGSERGQRGLDGGKCLVQRYLSRGLCFHPVEGQQQGVHEACDCLHLTAADLLELGVIDMVLPEEDPKDFSPIFQSSRPIWRTSCPS